MAIATNGGHISRALDFYNKEGKYFIIGGTEPWTKIENGILVTDDSTPEVPTVGDYKLKNVVALKKVDNTYLVIPTEETTDVLSYRNQNWKKVVAKLETTIGSAGVTAGSTVIPVESVAGMTVGSKLRINNMYEGAIKSMSGQLITLDTEAPDNIPAGSKVLGGALVEGAKYVYIDCYLNYDEFPIVQYRQIGLCTGVTPNTEDILRSANYTATGSTDEYTSLGILEVLDNRVPAQRDPNQKELLSLIIEF